MNAYRGEGVCRGDSVEERGEQEPGQAAGQQGSRGAGGRGGGEEGIRRETIEEIRKRVEIDIERNTTIVSTS